MVMEFEALATLHVALMSITLLMVLSNPLAPAVVAPVAVPEYGTIWPPGPGPVAPSATLIEAGESQKPV